MSHLGGCLASLHRESGNFLETLRDLSRKRGPFPGRSVCLQNLWGDLSPALYQPGEDSRCLALALDTAAWNSVKEGLQGKETAGVRQVRERKVAVGDTALLMREKGGGRRMHERS